MIGHGTWSRDAVHKRKSITSRDSSSLPTKARISTGPQLEVKPDMLTSDNALLRRWRPFRGVIGTGRQ
jgi:hypothetical protein